MLAATLAFSACGSAHEGIETPAGTPRREGRQDRRDRAAVRRPVRPRPRHQELRRPGHQAGQRGRDAIQGWKLELAAEDDTAKPDVGKNAATKLAARQRRRRRRRHAELQRRPVRRRRCSAARTSSRSRRPTPVPTLTRAADPRPPEARPYNELLPHLHHRRHPGPVRGRLRYDDADIKKVATIHDKKAYGQGLADAFTEEFKKGGGTVVAAETINPGRQGLLGRHPRSSAPTRRLVFYGGEYPQAGPLTQQMKAGRPQRPADGRRRHLRPNYIELAGKTRRR